LPPLNPISDQLLDLCPDFGVELHPGVRAAERLSGPGGVRGVDLLEPVTVLKILGPEPSSIVLLGTALLAVAMASARRLARKRA